MSTSENVTVENKMENKQAEPAEKKNPQNSGQNKNGAEQNGQRNGENNPNQNRQHNSGNQNGDKRNKFQKKNYEMQKKLKNLSSVTHDSNESIRRRKRRSQINKLNNKIIKKKNKGENGGHENMGAYDPESPIVIETGYLAIGDNRIGHLRTNEFSFFPQPNETMVPRDFIDSWGLRTGLNLKCETRNRKNNPGKVVTKIMEIEGGPVKDWKEVPHFQDLTSVNPYEFLKLSTPKDFDKSMCLMELMTPIGRGQRALIVAPPRSGKTVLMEKIVNGITANHPEVEAFLLLIDERPEEVTHLSRRVNATVFASCLDKPIDEHLSLSRMVIEIAQRRAEQGKDVVILLDSITRMARAFNNQLKSSGRTLSGGVDAQALQEPKKFFGAARKLEEGGSLTIIATALIQTGSQMDEVIFQEFKGTGNMELVLNRKIAEKRIWPAMDINMSGTRREELIMPESYYRASLKFRRYLSTMSEANQVQAAIQAMEKNDTTDDFVKEFVGG